MRTVFLVSLVTAIVTGTAWAQSWIPVGPPGGNVRALASDPRAPQRIYLGTAEGNFYRSDDGGRRWHRMRPGFPRRGCSLDEIAVDRRGVVYVGYWEINGSGGGVARSTDGGQTFAILKDLDGQSVRALAVAPSNWQVIAAGTLTGVFLSQDGGKNWSRVTPEGHRDLRNIESLAFDPTDPQVLYAGTWHLAWKTSDGGASWDPVHLGMIDDSHVMRLSIDRQQPQTVYATACSGIYRSADGGLEWKKLEGIPYSSRRTRAFSQSPEDSNVLLAGTTEGLWISQDHGGNWRQATPKELVVNALIVQRDGTILLGTEEAGVLRSTDRGWTWNASNNGFSERLVSKVLFDSEGRRLLVAVWGSARNAGVFVSPRVRGPWIQLVEGLEGRQVLSLALLDNTTLAGTDDGIFARSREATVWTRLRTRVNGREAHPRVTELLAFPPRRLLAATAKGLFLSADGGQTWTQPTLGKAGEVFGLVRSPVEVDRVIAATRSGFFRSSDGGETWEQISPELKGVTPHALAFMPSDDRVLFATTSGGLFRSGDQGVAWERVGGGIPHSDLTGIAMHPDGRTIYASDFTRGGIFRSVDAGSTWERMPTDGLASDRVWTLGLDPTTPERLLAASSAGGLHLLLQTSMATASGMGRSLPASP
jgi:photosystem II stability/assembly factor-like uncharacterized protein